MSHVFLTIDHFHTALGPKTTLVLENHHVSKETGKMVLKYYAVFVTNWRQTQMQHTTL